MTERWLRELRKLREAEMPPGLWERASERASDGIAARPSRRRAGMRPTFSVIAAAAAIALIAGAVFLVRGAAGTGDCAGPGSGIIVVAPICLALPTPRHPGKDDSAT